MQIWANLNAASKPIILVSECDTRTLLSANSWRPCNNHWETLYVRARATFSGGETSDPDIILLRQSLDGHVPEVNEVPHAGQFQSGDPHGLWEREPGPGSPEIYSEGRKS